MKNFTLYDLDNQVIASAQTPAQDIGGRWSTDFPSGHNFVGIYGCIGNCGDKNIWIRGLGMISYKR